MATTYRKKAALAWLASSKVWELHVTAKMVTLLKEGKPFTSDDLHIKTASTKDLRAVGPLVALTSQTGMIKRVGYRKSARKIAHQRPVSVWKPTRKGKQLAEQLTALKVTQATLNTIAELQPIDVFRKLSEDIN